ncbi:MULTISPECIES: threonine synthase [unclassified Massilimicrobiota]|jgi:threonine synthase|uniref:threonine synthase n=1 Tax=unclassified Massilimicrobiota TaxID=2619866 RepID=UPI000B3A1A29|nr:MULTISPECIES: threonine synthase [unclassified Massilimicrobiota]OUN35541.1 threonine synthase [Massilimicrobiota sp. An80]OUQ30508.1 threonine synthase [Massilimicrobiota sp. An134]HJA51996.1 threonine synthase [Candidatus Massilimicrobiota merdigallinarum]
MNEKKYVSTRGQQRPLDFCDAILQGIGSDGGLLVPDFELDQKDLKALQHLSYVDMATEIMTSFVGEQEKEEMRALCQKAYGQNLFPQEVVPVKQAGDVFIAELFQGPTAAFKDMALSLLPHFMTYSLKKKGEQRKVMILAATSGDTGKAALEGFKDVDGTYIQVFYPVDGVSPIQKQQMVTQTGNNVDVVGIQGNFDDAQRAVKQAFQSSALKDLCDEHHVFLSSANSINIGRLIPQIVYYFYSYMTLVNKNEIRLGESVHFTIPSGNFGNCLAGVLAKKMGLPIQKFIVASNKNNILTDFFRTGKYDARREFYKTNAPAMDILVSSNLERLVYMMAQDSQKVKSYMDDLNQNGVYEISSDLLEKIQDVFKAGWLNEDEVLDTIKTCFEQTGYLLDTHTAIGYGVYKEYQKTSGDETKTIILATASPYKFADSVYKALTDQSLSEYQAIEAVYEKTGVDIPKPLVQLDQKEILHQKVIDKDDIIHEISQKIKEMSL